MHVVGESSIGRIESLIAVVQKMGHPCFNMEDHLAKHTIGPAKPATVVSQGDCKNRRCNAEFTMTEYSLFRCVTQRSHV